MIGVQQANLFAKSGHGKGPPNVDGSKISGSLSSISGAVQLFPFSSHLGLVMHFEYPNEIIYA